MTTRSVSPNKRMPVVEDEATPSSTNSNKKRVSVDPDTPVNATAKRSSRKNPRAATRVTPMDKHKAAAVVTPFESASVEPVEPETPQPHARRALFPSSKTSSLVTPSQSLKRKTSSNNKQATAPAAKRRLIFGKLVDLITCQPNVTESYKIIKKLTGSIGGNGYCGPIYGELTMGSMQKMINLMMEHTHLDASSRFIDVGSGIGKPNIHVAQYPGVEFSCGVEMEHSRFFLGLTCLNAVLNAAMEQQKDGVALKEEEMIQGNCVFLHNNITEARTFDPFTHVYMFSIGKYCTEKGSCENAN